jgi:hypothetical protein
MDRSLVWTILLVVIPCLTVAFALVNKTINDAIVYHALGTSVAVMTMIVLASSSFYKATMNKTEHAATTSLRLIILGVLPILLVEASFRIVPKLLDIPTDQNLLPRITSAILIAAMLLYTAGKAIKRRYTTDKQ